MKTKAKTIKTKPESIYLTNIEKPKFYNLPWLGKNNK